MLRNLGIWVSFLVLVLSLALLIWNPRPIQNLRNVAFDAYQRIGPRIYEDRKVRIVDVDEESLKRLGQWPWPRARIAELVDRLDAAGVRVVGFDVIFAEPDRNAPTRMLERWGDIPALKTIAAALPDDDEVFAKALARTPTVLGLALSRLATPFPAPSPKVPIAVMGDDPAPHIARYRGAVPPLPGLLEATRGLGSINFDTTRGGIIRYIPLVAMLGDRLYPSLAVELARVWSGDDRMVLRSSGAETADSFAISTGISGLRIGKRDIRTDAEGNLWLHFTPPGRDRYIPAWKVLADDAFPAEVLADTIAIVGSSAAGLRDIRFTPFGPMPGVELHAQTLEQILAGDYLIRPDWVRGAEAIFLVLLWLTVVPLIMRLGAFWSAMVATAMLSCAFAVSWFAFTDGRLLIDPLMPAITAVALHIGCSLPRHIQSERRQRWIREAFSTYISPNLVEHLIDHPESLALGGERRECSFVMTDLAGFTSLVEGAEPTQIVALLNDYLDGMIQVALRHEGTIDRIVGDAVAVMFSAPVPQVDHARRAVDCALAMDAFARDFALRQQGRGIAVGRTRIGVNTGPVIVGNVGGASIFDYRALGDAVNTAARLESVNRHLGTNICVSASTAGASGGFIGRPVGDLVLVGKSEGIGAFEPLTGEAMTRAHVRHYMAAYDLLKAEDPGARDAFAAAHQAHPEDPLIAFHLARLDAGESGNTVVFAAK